MVLTPEMAVQVLARKLQKVRGVPSEVVDQAQRTLMPLIPVYTGTYKDSIFTKHENDSASLLITEESLVASAARNVPQDKWTIEEYIEDSPHYPPRIEASGRPTDASPSGQAAWKETAEFVKAAIPGAIRKAYNG